MPPVEQWPSPTGNPGASLYVRRRHGQRRAGASAATARRAGGGHGASAGSDWRPRAGRRRAPGASRRGCNTDCRDRSGCTRRPGCGTRRTGTDGPEGPTTPPDRAGSAGTESSQRATLLRHRLHRHGVGHGAVNQASRQERAAAVPTFFSSARVVLRRPPRPCRPVWPPCRAARQAPLIDQLLGSQYREPQPHEGCGPNPLPRRHKSAVPDQRSQADSHEPILIAGKRSSAVLVSEEDWKAIQETMYLLSMPGMRKSIREAMAEPLATSAKELRW